MPHEVNSCATGYRHLCGLQHFELSSTSDEYTRHLLGELRAVRPRQIPLAADACRELRARFAEAPDPRRTRGAFVPPHEATLRRTVQAFDADLLDQVIGSWLSQRAGAADPAAIAVDGKTGRGAYRPDGSQVHLLSAITHDHGTVIAGREVAAKTNEITEFKPLPTDLDLAGVVVTADALHTQRATAEYLVIEKRAHYLLTVKANEPRLLGACRNVLAGPVYDFVPEHVVADRGHGGTEQRTTRVKAITGGEGIDFPPAAQMFRVRRDTGGLYGQRTGKEIAYCITSQSAHQADPARLAALVRGH